MRRVSVLSLAFVLCLTACGAQGDTPTIRFVGIGTGTLLTPLDNIQFADRFRPDQRELVAVVAFDRAVDGSTVQATWFSPDERRMPLGRSTIVTDSGATIVRFKFVSTNDWRMAPYQLRVDAMKGEGEDMRTSSGSVSFFIGMEEEDIALYQEDFRAWQAAEAADRAVWEERQRAEEAVVTAAKELMGSDHATLLLRSDVDGDGAEEFLVTDLETPPMSAPAGAVLASATVGQFALVNGSGSSILLIAQRGSARVLEAEGKVISDDLPRYTPLDMVLLTSGTVSLTWNDKAQTCTIEVRRTDDVYSAGEPVCRAAAQ